MQVCTYTDLGFVNTKGCSGFAAIASDVTFGVDADKVITPAVELAKAALEASAGTPSIKRFVQTSSSAAAVKSEVPAGTPYDLAVDNFNEYAVQQAYRPDGAKDPAQPFWVYMASKVQQEKAIWKWREDKRKQGVLGFGINTVLPDFVVGEILQVEKQGYPSSLGMLKAVWDGDLATASTLPPQFEIDAKDTAMLHIAALLHPDVDGERIFGFAELKNLTNTLQYMRELYPDRTFAEAPAGERENKANLLGQKRAEELLRWVKGSGWTSYKESLKQVCDTLL